MAKHGGAVGIKEGKVSFTICPDADGYTVRVFRVHEGKLREILSEFCHTLEEARAVAADMCGDDCRGLDADEGGR